MALSIPGRITGVAFANRFVEDEKALSQFLNCNIGYKNLGIGCIAELEYRADGSPLVHVKFDGEVRNRQFNSDACQGWEILDPSLTVEEYSWATSPHYC